MNYEGFEIFLIQELPKIPGDILPSLSPNMINDAKSGLELRW